MATKKTEKSNDEKSEVKFNIAEIIALAKEYRTGQMPDRKSIVLKNKLVELYGDSKVTMFKPESELLELMLYHDKKRGVISNAHAEVLNRIEMATAEDVCFVHAEYTPMALYLEKGKECKFKFDPMDKRYEVFVPVVMQSDMQYSMELARKLEQKLPVSADEYPKQKTRIHKLELSENEFKAWLTPIEDELKASKVEEEVYQF